DAQVAGELERLATATDKWNDLLGEYTQVVQSITEPRTAADLWVKIGRWYGEHLNHLDYAIAAEQQALTLDGNHREALLALSDFYRRTSRWPELVSTLSRHVELEEDANKRVEIFMSLAELWETQLGDLDQAVEAYTQALEADPSTLPALSALERLYGRAE